MRSTNYGPVIQRALLTRELQRLRHASGETQGAVAQALEWSLSKLIRLEGGHVGFSRSDLEALLRHYGVADDDYIAVQVERARKARQSGWWAEYKLADKEFQTYIGYEEGASSILMTHGLLVPGLLQTKAYRRIILKAYGVPDDDLDRLLAFSGERQEKVLQSAPRRHFILDEAVIQRSVDNVMSEQLQRLIEFSEHPKITIQVIPFTAGPHPGMKGPFVVLGFDGVLDDLLYLENDLHGDVVDDDRAGECRVVRDGDSGTQGTGVINVYKDRFKGLTEMASTPAHSKKMIEDLMRKETLVTDAMKSERSTMTAIG